MREMRDGERATRALAEKQRLHIARIFLETEIDSFWHWGDDANADMPNKDPPIRAHGENSPFFLLLHII